jgi:Protein of unknown function (DUF3309)
MLEWKVVAISGSLNAQTIFDLRRRRTIRMGTLLLIILILLLIGGLPTWPYSRRWGYGPSGGLGTVLVILLILILLGYVPRGF